MRILSLRNIQNWPSFDLVYEWEDVLSHSLAAPLLLENTKFTNRHIRKIPCLYALRRLGQQIFAFEMGPEIRSGHRESRNYSKYIPCIIDFFLTKEDISAFEKQYSRHKYIFITSREAYEFLKQNQCKLNIFHLPLSLPDKYKVQEQILLPKKYDLVLMGRQNIVLENYLSLYLSENPQLYVVFRKMENGKFLYFTNRGECLGDISTRKQYISLMQQGKASLYSTPGMDDESNRTHGFNQVTPRFLEMLACGVNPIMRYPDNSDTRYFELRRFGGAIDSYEEFVSELEKAVNIPADMKLNATYLNKHYTSTLTEKIKKIMSE